ncbi:MAG TPA: N-acetyltransferase [Candidatus Yaniella excrementavium]|nr:N-acetyltransferase [Candidatus Yaniella excrementavium]
MTIPSTNHPQFIEHEGYIGMIVDDSETIAAREIYRNHETAEGTKQRVFIETVVEEDYRGAGLAGKLVQYSLDKAIDQGYRIVAICPYVKSWIEKSDDKRYSDVSDTARPEHFN